MDTGVNVRWIAEKVIERVSPAAVLNFGVSNKGWIGDVPRFKYSTSKLNSLKWTPKLGSSEAIERAIQEIALQFEI